MTSSAKAPTSSGDQKGGKTLSQCSYCDMSFKKLEHAQRHERTHSGVRPYTCPFSGCGKSFARQDTLRRHARLHNRKDDDSKPAKGRRRRVSVSSAGTARSETSEEPTTPRSPILPLYSQSLPSPTFHSFSRPAPAVPTHHQQHGRRYSDASYPSLMGLSIDLSSHTIPEDPLMGKFGKMHSMTVDNLGSPASSSSSSSSEGDDSNDGTYSQGGDKVESQYPSPAFTSYSPSSLHDTTISDLEAILANDPLHASMSASSRHVHRTSSANPIDDHAFDFEQFAASVEGPSPSDVLAYDNILNGVGSMSSAINIEPYPTPRLSSQPTGGLQLHDQFSLDFDFSSAKIVEEQQRLMREQQKQQKVQQVQQLRNSMTMPSMTMPTLATATNQPRPSPTATSNANSNSYPSAALASAYASSFPSLSVMPNTLGLHSSTDNQTAESILYAAYLKRKGLTAQQQQQQQQAPPLPAFYVPSNGHGRLAVPMPSWSPGARDSMSLHESREPGALFVI